jgi:hypothetical protein
MKKIFLILAGLFLLAVSASAHIPFDVLCRQAPTGSTPVECTACPAANGEGNILCESYYGVGYSCSSPAWSEDGSSGIDEDNATGGTYGCTDADSENVECSYAYSTDSDSVAVATISANANIYARFNFRVASHDIDAGDYIGLFALSTEGGCSGSGISGYAVVARIYNNSGTLIMTTRYRDSGGTYDTANGSNTITVGTWYTMQVTWLSGSQVKIVWSELDGSNSETLIDDSSDIHTQSPTCVWAPAAESYFNINENAGDVIVYEIDRLKVDSGSMPAGCSL